MYITATFEFFVGSAQMKIWHAMFLLSTACSSAAFGQGISVAAIGEKRPILMYSAFKGDCSIQSSMLPGWKCDNIKIENYEGSSERSVEIRHGYDWIARYTGIFDASRKIVLSNIYFSGQYRTPHAGSGFCRVDETAFTSGRPSLFVITCRFTDKKSKKSFNVSFKGNDWDGRSPR